MIVEVDGVRLDHRRDRFSLHYRRNRPTVAMLNGRHLRPGQRVDIDGESAFVQTEENFVGLAVEMMLASEW